MEQEPLILTPKGEDGYCTFSIRIRKESLSAIEEFAKQTNRSRNEIIGTFLDYAIKHCIVNDTEKQDTQ